MKYQKVKGHWNYCFIFSDGMFYIGESGDKYCCERWQPSRYKNTVVAPYIEKEGWENIRKVVLCDGLTKEQALQLEDLLILEASKGGWCINKQRSGNITSNRCEYYKQIYRDKRIEKLEYQKQYHKNNPDYRKKWFKKHRDEHLEKMKLYNEQRRSTPEGKIYGRVANFNRLHPDKVIETPLEAKNKYLEYGYIPSYIKNDDLV